MAVLPDKPTLNVREAADALGVSYMTIWKRVTSGEYPSFHVGTRVRIPRNDLEALIAAQTTGGVAS